MAMHDLRKRLEASLPREGRLAVAVSGGVDSMTLAHVAHRAAPGRTSMFHAISPAVPKAATARVRRHAQAEGWHLVEIDAGEFADEDYLANPANRCFFCKQNLYGTIVERTQDQVLSGTNLDDLSDYRPGLAAAEAAQVRHPFVEAGIDKAGVRAIAQELGLDDLAELPAAPCLSSRIETGIRIEPRLPPLIDAAEQLLRLETEAETVRCRVRREAVVIELDAATLHKLDGTRRDRLAVVIGRVFGELATGPVRFAAYRQGSAFLRATAHA